MSKIKSTKVVINCVDYNDKHVISTIGYTFTTTDDLGKEDSTKSNSSGTKSELISKIEGVENDNSIKVSIETKGGTVVNVVKEDDGSKYLRTKGNTSKTDDLDDLGSCTKK